AERLRNELTGAARQRAKLEVCIATIHENRRLAQFAKYCSGRNCDLGAVREEIDRQLAAGTTRPLAEQGFATAQNNLGVAYVNGQGVPRNYVEAAKWFRLAADQDDAIAQYNLGLLIAGGLGVWPDLTEAAKWFRLAADQGHPGAQY